MTRHHKVPSAVLALPQLYTAPNALLQVVVNEVVNAVGVQHFRKRVAVIHLVIQFLRLEFVNHDAVLWNVCIIRRHPLFRRLLVQIGIQHTVKKLQSLPLEPR